MTNGDGIAGFGGDAQLLVVKAGPGDGTFTDVDEAAGITYAIDHGARIINLSFGGAGTTSIERNAVRYAIDHGALVVAAAGNEFGRGNPVEYPAALLQPVGSDGAGGAGLSVGASTQTGHAGPFLEHRLVDLARGARGERLRRPVVAVARVDVPALAAARLAERRLRLLERHLVRGAAGRRSGRARLGARTRS